MSKITLKIARKIGFEPITNITTRLRTGLEPAGHTNEYPYILKNVIKTKKPNFFRVRVYLLFMLFILPVII